MSLDADLGDRMKAYEATPRLLPLLPTLVRLDGKNFHGFCNGLRRPYDERLSSVMQGVTAYLLEETRAVVGYTQSDEITLCLYSADYKSQTFFDGKTQKIVSVLASMCTLEFQRRCRQELPEKADARALFDCRVFQVPTLDEAANVFVWRELDATRNSLEMAARHYYSQKELHGKNSAALHEMLHTVDVNWNDYPGLFKRGTYYGWRDEPLTLRVVRLGDVDGGTIRVHKRVTALQLEPILSYPDRVKVLFPCTVADSE